MTFSGILPKMADWDVFQSLQEYNWPRHCQCTFWLQSVCYRVHQLPFRHYHNEGKEWNRKEGTQQEILLQANLQNALKIQEGENRHRCSVGGCHQTQVHWGTYQDSWCIGFKMRDSLLTQLLPFELFSKKFCLNISELGLEIL